MVDLLIAPTERPPFSQLGQSSSLPERLGVDCIWSAEHGTCGVQRKEVMDLIASVRDGRLGREIQQMQSLAHAFLVIEGQPSWDREGNLSSQHTRWSLRQQWGVELSVQRSGIQVLKTRSALETCQIVEYLVEWTGKPEHVSSLLARPGPSKNGWGKMDPRSVAIHVMSGWPSVSVELSGRIFDHYERIPCRHDVAEIPLTDVDGIGPKRAAAIAEVLA